MTLMYQNEKKIVEFARLIDTARSIVKTVDNCLLKKANKGDLVCVSGTSLNKQDLFDSEFGVVAEDSYRLSRKVEMFQWRENPKTDPVTQAAGFEYDQIWSEDPIDSKKFHEVGFDNPEAGKWPFKSQVITAKNVMVGEYCLNESQCS